LIDNVEKFIQRENEEELVALYNAAQACLQKLKKYYEKTDHCSLYPIATSNNIYNDSSKSMLQIEIIFEATIYTSRNKCL
jgi:galactose-1-phosphate uridylyltransferase